MPWERPGEKFVAGPPPPAHLGTVQEPDDATVTVDGDVAHWVQSPYGLAPAQEPSDSASDTPEIAGAPWATKPAAAVIAPHDAVETTTLDRKLLLQLLAGQVPESLPKAQGIWATPHKGSMVPLLSEGQIETASLSSQLRPPQPSLTIIAKAVYELHTDGSLTPAKPDPCSGPRYRDDNPMASLLRDSDLAVFKGRCDVTLVGHAHSGGKPVESMKVRLSVGDDDNRFERELLVFGDRTWHPGATLDQIEAQPFVSVPLSYEKAYGGVGFVANPVGVGHNAKRDGPSCMPNVVESGEDLDTSHVATPSCFAPRPLAWRLALHGKATYDDDWLHNRWPHPPDDFDHTAYQSAPVQQQLNHLSGGESFTLFGMHPDKPTIVGELPRQQVRAFLQKTDEAGADFVSLAMNLDTVAFDLDNMQLELVWRGIVDVSDDIASDISSGFVVLLDEDTELDMQTARKQHQAKLRESGMVEQEPPEPPSPPSHNKPASPSSEQQSAMQQAVRAKMAAGLPLGPVLLPGADLSGFDFSEQNLAGANLKGAILNGCHFVGADLTLAQLSHADLTGAVLDSARLSNADLSDAKLGGASFAGALLDQVAFTRCQGDATIFRQASGDHTRFDAGSWCQANFEGSDLEDADFTGSKLDSAVFDRADLHRISLLEVRGENVSFVTAKLNGARADTAQLPHARFEGCDLSSSVWEDANLVGANFTSAVAVDSSFTQANCAHAQFDRASLQQCRFSKAQLVSATFVHANAMEASFDRADLTDADMTDANLYAASCHGAVTNQLVRQGAIVARSGFESDNARHERNPPRDDASSQGASS